jgi:hypothetical protein
MNMSESIHPPQLTANGAGADWLVIATHAAGLSSLLPVGNVTGLSLLARTLELRLQQESVRFECVAPVGELNCGLIVIPCANWREAFAVVKEELETTGMADIALVGPLDIGEGVFRIVQPPGGGVMHMDKFRELMGGLHGVVDARLQLAKEETRHRTQRDA